MNLRVGKSDRLSTLTLKDLVAVLTETWTTEHFVLHYVLRNPLVGPGQSKHGVYSQALIQAYAEALEAAYRLLRAEPWQRQPPLTNPQHGRTDVFIGDAPEPFVTAWRGQCPVLVLPSSRTLVDDRERVLAEAAHEIMHLFNFNQRPFMAINGDWQAVLESARWKWLDEGMALCLEGLVFEQNLERYRFARPWVNQPETPLDNKQAIYQTGLFVNYLYRRFGIGLVNEVWLTAGRAETPWAAFDRVLRPLGTDFAEVFTDYCAEAFLLRDPASHCYEPGIEERFGLRALTESFVLSTGAQHQVTSQLDHLACRYFRFVLADGVRNLRVCLLTKTAPENIVLRAELAELTPAGTRGKRQQLLQQSEGQLTAPVCLQTEWPDAGSQPERQLILVVSNFGCRPQLENLQIPHDDGQTFTLEITAA